MHCLDTSLRCFLKYISPTDFICTSWGGQLQKQSVTCLGSAVTGFLGVFSPLMCLLLKIFIFNIVVANPFVSFSCRTRFFWFSCQKYKNIYTIKYKKEWSILTSSTFSWLCSEWEVEPYDHRGPLQPEVFCGQICYLQYLMLGLGSFQLVQGLAETVDGISDCGVFLSCPSSIQNERLNIVDRIFVGAGRSCA